MNSTQLSFSQAYPVFVMDIPKLRRAEKMEEVFWYDSVRMLCCVTKAWLFTNALTHLLQADQESQWILHASVALQYDGAENVVGTGGPTNLPCLQGELSEDRRTPA